MSSDRYSLMGTVALNRFCLFLSSLCYLCSLHSKSSCLQLRRVCSANISIRPIFSRNDTHSNSQLHWIVDMMVPQRWQITTLRTTLMIIIVSSWSFVNPIIDIRRFIVFYLKAKSALHTIALLGYPLLICACSLDDFYAPFGANYKNNCHEKN